jgi:gliding motility-associated-like protein
VVTTAQCTSNGVQSLRSEAVGPTIVINPDITLEDDTTICLGESAILTATENAGTLGNITYDLYDASGPTGQSNTTGVFTVSEEGSYYVSATTDIASCSAFSNDVQVDVIEQTVSISSTEDPDRVIRQGESVDLTAIPSNTSTFIWTGGTTSNPYTVTPSSTTTFTVTATSVDGECEATSDIMINVIEIPDPPNVFTPPSGGGGINAGDGKNDIWKLKHIDNPVFDEAVIKVFNRWGNIVYEGNGGEAYILDPFDGTRNGKDLPAAVYYYVIDLGVDDITLKGSVTIVR